MSNVQKNYSQSSDAQTLYIKEALAKVNLAVNVLAALGLTVLSVNIKTAKPKIYIQPGKACSQLQNVAYKFWPTPQGRRKESVAHVSDCEVHWEEGA